MVPKEKPRQSRGFGAGLGLRASADGVDDIGSGAVAAEAFAVTDDFASEALVEIDSSGIVGEAVKLNAVVTLLVGLIDESAEELAADAVSATIAVGAKVGDDKGARTGSLRFGLEPIEVLRVNLFGTGCGRNLAVVEVERSVVFEMAEGADNLLLGDIFGDDDILVVEDVAGRREQATQSLQPEFAIAAEPVGINVWVSVVEEGGNLKGGVVGMGGANADGTLRLVDGRKTFHE